MGNILGLKRGNAIRNIDDLGYQLFETFGLKFIENEQMSILRAGTCRDDNGYATEVEIGTSELENAEDGKFHLTRDNIKISDEMFVWVILNMYHENAHCVQKNELFRQANLDGHTRNQLVQEIACNASYKYYGGESNYRLNASEIQAEKEGILGAYEYLCNGFPDIDKKEHEHIVLNIVNDKMMNSSYFVKQSKPFTSLREVEDAFDKAYDNSFTQKRTFLMEREPKDPVKIFMNDHEDANEMYCTESIAVKQDKYIAAIALKLHPEWLKSYPALQDMDLSYENVIAKSYREREERKNHALHTKEEKINEILDFTVKSVNIPVQKCCDKTELSNLSRSERLERLEKKVSHLMPNETSTKSADDEYGNY